MATPDIFFLIEKYFRKNISEDELTTLKNLLENEENANIFKNLVKDDYQLKTKNVDFNTKESFAKIEPKLEIVESKKVIQLKPFYKHVAAASILLIVALIVFLNNKNNESQFVAPIIVNTKTIEPGTNKATLTLEDGSNITLEEGKSFKNKNISNDEGKLVYNSKNNKVSKIVYNYLTIPRGGEYYIKLSDGTQVWLNSESQLKFPKAFIEGETREVELVYGEAYFDVSPSTEHNGSNFKVHNRSQSIDVLGTQFNIKAYKDEFNVYTTLVEGKVVVDIGITKQRLMPSEQSNLNIETRSIDVALVDVEEVVSWKNGVFSFKGKPLKDIMKVVSRWYDIEVVFENKALEIITFKGVLGKDQNLEEILETIKTLSVLKEYKIANNLVILK